MVTNNVTEDQIRSWVRSEQERITGEQQAACLHMVSGTLHNDGRVICDQCSKLMTTADWSSHTRLADDEREGFEV